jgi:D-sedoheptulose 7-phosphate isomerase
MKSILAHTIQDLAELLPRIAELEPQLTRLGEALMTSWNAGGKALIAGNGGSAADAMHLAEELVVRFQKNRRALPAMALLDPTALTCAANDFGYDSVFSRQVEAFGRPGDVLIVFTTSGNSPNILKALDGARQRKLLTAGFLGKDGGRAMGLCDIPLRVPSGVTARVQEGHKILYHSLCEWVDQEVE